MSRKLKNGFLQSYEEFADDGFSPPQFNTWTALSIIAGALERRVWFPWNSEYTFYPNIYVLLVSRPGKGKSVSSGKGVSILREVARRSGALNVMPAQVTEAKFIELMGHGRSFMNTTDGREITVFQNAGYYYASEASNSLRNIFGDFIACLTDFYDCPEVWERATKKDGNRIQLKNVCMNILAGSTFDYLGKLVSDENIQGGFASRILYVVQYDDSPRDQLFQGGETDAIKSLRATYKEALIQDLTEIAKMVGPMQAAPGVGEAWQSWHKAHEKKISAMSSEHLQSVLARTNTNVIKTTILLSASESSDRIIKLSHFERAVELVEAVTKEVPKIFMRSKLAQAPGKGGNYETARRILHHVQSHPRITDESLRNEMIATGMKKWEFDDVLKSLIGKGDIAQGNCAAGKGVELIAHSNAHDYL
jgi:uncharacterized protein DUF3987